MNELANIDQFLGTMNGSRDVCVFNYVRGFVSPRHNSGRTSTQRQMPRLGWGEALRKEMARRKAFGEGRQPTDYTQVPIPDQHVNALITKIMQDADALKNKDISAAVLRLRNSLGLAFRISDFRAFAKELQSTNNLLKPLYQMWQEKGTVVNNVLGTIQDAHQNLVSLAKITKVAQQAMRSANPRQRQRPGAATAGAGY